MTGPPMSFMNPHLFAAILDGIAYRMIVVQECECVQGNEEYCPPRFSVGAINGTRDPRMAQFKQLLEVGVQCDNLHIPSGYLMAHQYIYVVNDGTDEHGWQYRNDWNTNIITNFQKENDAWSAFYEPNCYVRRRIWFTTIVPRLDLVRAKRLLSENCKMDPGHIRMQGELFRYEKGNMSKSWQKRKVTLFHNRLEFYSGSNKKGEVNLTDCEVRMLFESQCPGKEYAFSIRNPLGTVGVLLDAENQESRRAWVLAIQYQLAMNSHEMNFPPLEYGPPTGEEPDNRVFVCSDLNIYSTRANGYIVRNVQLHSRELCLFDGETMTGRIFLEKALVQGSDEKSFLLSVKSFSGIQFNFSADTAELKNMWVNGLRRQVQFIENQKLKLKNTPAEEQDVEDIPVVDRICQFYDGLWTAPAVDGEDEEYLERVFAAASENHPNHIEFCEEGTSNNHNSLFVDKPIEQPVTHIGANNSSMARKPSFRQEGSPASSGIVRKASFKETVAVVVTPPPAAAAAAASSALSSGFSAPASPTPASPAPGAAASSPSDQYKRSASSGTLKPASSFINLHQASTKLIDTRRSLINPKCVLNALNQLTHRFVLVLECESRVPPVNSNGKSMRINPVTVFPARFTVGGARACRDPRVTTLDQLLAISNINPEIQLPTGWLMLHQYIHIIQQNTDENGWQYRSDWSNGPVTPKEEQWSEVCNEDKYVRRRLWMTTVVKKEDLIKAKKLLSDSLDEGVNKDAIMQGNLYVHEKGIEPLAGDNVDEKRNSLSFVKRRVLLLHNRIEFYLGAEKTGEHSLTDCEVRILVGAQCPGRKHAFSLRNPSGSVAIVFDAESKEARLRWVRYLYYQIALIAPDINFHPFLYGPPLGDLFENKPIYAGELNKQNEFKKWMKYQFVLKLNELLFYNRDILKGRLFLKDAVLMARDDDQDFTVKTASGLVLSVRADSMDLKNCWVRAIRHQIQYCEGVELRKINTPAEELVDPLTPKERRRQFQDEGWCAPEEDDSEDNAYMQSLATAMQKNRFEFLEDEDSLISGSTNSNVSTNSIRTVEEELMAAKMAQSPKYHDSRGHHYSPSNLQLYGGTFAGDVKDDKKFQYVHWDKFPLFNYKIHQSLMAQYLTPELFAQLNDKVTHKKYTLSNLIMDGVLNPESSRVGVNVGDAECYGIFNPLLTPVIEKIHGGYNYNREKHTNSMDISGIDIPPKVQVLFQDYVSFIRFNCVRNFTGYSFLCGTIDSERVEIENMLYKLFSLFRDDSAGEYFKLDQLTQSQKEFLDDCSYLFEVPTERFITTGTGSGADRAYPHNRGIFVNTTRSTYIWVNEEDHARIIVTDSGHDLIGTFGQFARLHGLIEELAKKLGHSFMHSESLGYLSSNLTRLGTGLKISVLVYLPTFNRLMTERSKDANQDVEAITLLEDVCQLFNLTSSGENGVHTSARDDKFDICNTQYLGVTEAEVLGKLIAGVTSLIEFDILLSNGATVEEVRQVMKKPTAKGTPRAGGASAGAAVAAPAPAEAAAPATVNTTTTNTRVFKSAGGSSGAEGKTSAAASAADEPVAAAAPPARLETSKSFLVDPVKSQSHDEDYNASFQAALEKMREAERIMNMPIQRAATPEPVVVNNVVEVHNEENNETINNTKHTEVRYETNVEERFEVVTGEGLDEVVREYSQHHYNETHSSAHGQQHSPITSFTNTPSGSNNNLIAITNGEESKFAMPPLNTISGFQEERRRQLQQQLEEEDEGELSPTSASKHRRGQNTFFDSAFTDDKLHQHQQQQQPPAADITITVTETHSSGINDQQLAEALRVAANEASDSDDYGDRVKAPRDIKLPTDSHDEYQVTSVPKNTPMSAPASAVSTSAAAPARKPLSATTYEESDSDEEEENSALKMARAAMAAHSAGSSARVVPPASVQVQVTQQQQQQPARKTAVEYESSDSEDDDNNEAMKNAMAAMKARNAAPAAAPVEAPKKPSPQASSQPSALIASLFNKKPAEGDSLKAQFVANKSATTVEPPKAQSPVPSTAAAVESREQIESEEEDEVEDRVMLTTEQRQLAQRTPPPQPANVRNFVIPGMNKTNSLVAAIQAEKEGPSELETVQLQETNNLDKSTGELVNRHSLWEEQQKAEAQKQREHHERLVALRPVEVNTPTPTASSSSASAASAAAAGSEEQLTGPARLVKLRSVANPNPIFLNDLAAASSQAANSPLVSAYSQQSRSFKASPENKLTIETSSATHQESRIPAPSPLKQQYSSDSALNSPSPAAGATTSPTETETPTGPKRLVKLRSVAKLTDYHGQPTKLPGPVTNREASPMRSPTSAAAAPTVQISPTPAAATASAPKAVAPLVPAVPAPFVPQQSVKLKSTGLSEKTADASAAAPAASASANDSPTSPKPMFKLRSTGFGLNASTSGSNGSSSSSGGTSSTDAAAAAPISSPSGSRPILAHQTSKIGEYKPPASFVPKTSSSSSSSGVSPLLSVKLRSTGILNNEVNNTSTNEVHVKATVPTVKNSSSSGGEANVPSQIVKLRSVAAARAAEEAGSESESMKGRKLDMNQ